MLKASSSHWRSGSRDDQPASLHSAFLASSTSLASSVISTHSAVLHAAVHSSWNVPSWCALRPREVAGGGVAYSPVRGVQRLRGLQN